MLIFGLIDQESRSMAFPKIPLEQWAAFIAIVEAGSFARAAEELNKSQSAVSYAMARLEEQLPAPVLKQEGRKAVLTPSGEVLYRRARQLLNLAQDVEQTAQFLAEGWESQINIAIDALVPIEPVLDSLSDFAETAPQTRVQLLETTLSGTDEALFERQANLAITPRVPPGFLATPIGEVSLIAVAHPKYELARSETVITEQDLKQARQIVVRDSGHKRNQDQGWLAAEKRITVSHFTTTLKALEAGLGFAFAPEHLVREALQDKRLVRLQLTQHAERRLPLYLIQVSPDQTGPAVNAYSEIVQKSFSRFFKRHRRTA